MYVCVCIHALNPLETGGGDKMIQSSYNKRWRDLDCHPCLFGITEVYSMIDINIWRIRDLRTKNRRRKKPLLKLNVSSHENSHHLNWKKGSCLAILYFFRNFSCLSKQNTRTLTPSNVPSRPKQSDSSPKWFWSVLDNLSVYNLTCFLGRLVSSRTEQT